MAVASTLSGSSRLGPPHGDAARWSCCARRSNARRRRPATRPSSSARRSGLIGDRDVHLDVACRARRRSPGGGGAGGGGGGACVRSRSSPRSLGPASARAAGGCVALAAGRARPPWLGRACGRAGSARGKSWVNVGAPSTAVAMRRWRWTFTVSPRRRAGRSRWAPAGCPRARCLRVVRPAPRPAAPARWTRVRWVAIPRALAPTSVRRRQVIAAAIGPLARLGIAAERCRRDSSGAPVLLCSCAPVFLVAASRTPRKGSMPQYACGGSTGCTTSCGCAPGADGHRTHGRGIRRHRRRRVCSRTCRSLCHVAPRTASIVAATGSTHRGRR